MAVLMVTNSAETAAMIVAPVTVMSPIEVAWWY